MPKNRRNRSRNRGDRGGDRAKMRMDDVRSGPGRRENDNRSGRGRRTSNSPRRRELGDAMERARKDGGQSSFWTKKLLEAEARVPDRWRHSGFGEMYRDELRKTSRSNSSSSSSRSSRSRSPIERPKSPVGRRPRTPVKNAKDKLQKPRPRSPPSPPSRQSDARDRSRGRPRTPTHRQRIAHKKSQRSSHSSFSSSGSESSCSDDDCSICTPKHRKQKRNSRSPLSPSPPPPPKKVIKRVVNNNNKKSGRKTPPEPGRKKQRVAERRPKSPPRPRTPSRSTSGSSSSSSDSEDSSGEINETPKMSLSERFGKMAQWSVDRREYDSVSMKITKDSAAPGMKVVIEDGAEIELPVSRHERPAPRRESPDRDYAFHYERRRYFFERTFTEDRPAGPDAPVNWSDPLIRYSYYRRKGLLWETDVSFDEYFKWENWWQRYKEWLEVERACFGEDAALDNARRERERDWESYRSSNLGRSPLDKEVLPLPRNEPWLSKKGGLGKNVINRGAEGFVTRKYLRI